MVETQLTQLGILIFEIGILISFSMFVVFILKKFGIPAVLSLIVGGLVLGLLLEFQVLFFSTDFGDIKILITELALAWIGFNIGDELDLNILKSKGKDFGLILIGEAFGAYIIVFIGILLLTSNFALAIILAAIAMATAPASTSQILGEYEAKGELSTVILFVLALDDLLAILFFNMALAFVSASSFAGLELIIFMFDGFFQEIIITLLFGAGGAILIVLLNYLGVIEEDKTFEWLLGIGISVVGLTLSLGGSVILTMFVFGVASKYLVSKGILKQDHITQTETMMIPIVTLFFILVGLEMNFNLIFEEISFLFDNFSISLLGSSVIVITIVYFLARAFGKAGGVLTVSSFTSLPTKVKNNLPYSLITQAGVAVGLAGLASNYLSGSHPLEASTILIVVTVSVIIAELVGPLLVKRAIFQAGEVNQVKNSTKLLDS